MKPMMILAAPRPEYTTLILCLFQQSHCTFCRHFLWTLCYVVPQPGGVQKSTFPRIGIPLQTCRTSTLVNATFHKRDSRKYPSYGPCMACELFSQTGFGLRDFSLWLNFSYLASSKVLEKERAVSQHFHAYVIVPETAIVSFRTLPTDLQPSTNSVSFVNTTLFPLIFDQRV